MKKPRVHGERLQTKYQISCAEMNECGADLKSQIQSFNGESFILRLKESPEWADGRDYRISFAHHPEQKKLASEALKAH